MGSAAPPLDLIVVVPVRSLEGAKTRLGEALDPEERLELTARLLVRVVGAVRTWGRNRETIVVSPDPAVLELAVRLGARALRQASSGLNEALEEARSDPSVASAGALLVLHADLPAISPGALDRVVDAADGATIAATAPVAVVITDRRGEGTNALLLRPPGLLPFAFGPGSHRAHLEAARAAGAAAISLTDHELSFDLDTPDDLLALDGVTAGDERIVP
ncbi:MAG: 2-phospho-L-lactate guanylyltransferase [Chloroflexi bacterium GWC2_73_18]|nr:MAG: 2-phospho-L-lactate guanylyltransferase [Chloroflexi bacterium GWC2_73_18]